MSAKKTILLFAFAFCISTAAHSQSVFYMSYRFHSIADTNLYHVFLVRHDDGTGFYRVRFYDALSKDDIVVEMDMAEDYVKDGNGYIDTTKLYVRGFSPKVVYGDTTYHHIPEIFWFKLDLPTDQFEPWGVTSPDDKGNTAHGKFEDPPELVGQEDLTVEFVEKFFLENEEFYQSLFKVQSRALTPQEKQANLHLVIVANTEDETIGNTCVLDKDRTYKTFKDLAEFLGIGFNAKVIFGNTYSKQNVQAAVQSVVPSQKDIVVFYYSGHGFADKNPAKVFPNMALSNKSFEDAVASSMNIEDVYTELRRKGARLNLVISDCCNNAPDDLALLSCDIPATRSSGLGWSLENCKNLFMNDKPMSILMTAARKGEQSTGNAAYGGFFTNQFRSNLITHFGPFHQYPTWDVILAQSTKSTTEQAENSRCSESNSPLKTYKQHPVYRIQR